MAAQKSHSSTQKFTEIKDILEDIVLLEGGSACLVIEVQATNFALLSEEEKTAKISTYAALLNSLSVPIQIVIRNKRVDISAYLKLLDLEAQRLNSSSALTQSESQNKQIERLIAHMKSYREFVQEMIKINVVLDKKFYIVVSYSGLEKGMEGMIKKEDFASEAKANLHIKAESLLAQLARLSLRAKVLEKEELIKLFYDIYNQEDSGDITNMEDFAKPTVVKSQ